MIHYKTANKFVKILKIFDIQRVIKKYKTIPANYLGLENLLKQFGNLQPVIYCNEKFYNHLLSENCLFDNFDNNETTNNKNGNKFRIRNAAPGPKVKIIKTTKTNKICIIKSVSRRYSLICDICKM